MVTSASPPPSLTVRLPSRTSTSHCPSPSMSNRYELLTPPSLDSSTRDSRPSKNSLAGTALLSRVDAAIVRGRKRRVPPTGRAPSDSARRKLRLEPCAPRRRQEGCERECRDGNDRCDPHR